jgi:hypothetical protein
MQYVAVAAGAFGGMLWPFLVALWKELSPDRSRAALDRVLPTQVGRSANIGTGWKFLIWLVLTAVIAAGVALLNIVPLVTGDVGKKLAELGGWQYAFLAAEGFALASFFEEGLKPR